MKRMPTAMAPLHKSTGNCQFNDLTSPPSQPESCLVQLPPHSQRMLVNPALFAFLSSTKHQLLTPPISARAWDSEAGIPYSRFVSDEDVFCAVLSRCRAVMNYLDSPPQVADPAEFQAMLVDKLQADTDLLADFLAGLRSHLEDPPKARPNIGFTSPVPLHFCCLKLRFQPLEAMPHVPYALQLYALMTPTISPTMDSRKAPASGFGMMPHLMPPAPSLLSLLMGIKALQLPIVDMLLDITIAACQNHRLAVQAEWATEVGLVRSCAEASHTCSHPQQKRRILWLPFPAPGYFESSLPSACGLLFQPLKLVVLPVCHSGVGPGRGARTADDTRSSIQKSLHG